MCGAPLAAQGGTGSSIVKFMGIGCGGFLLLFLFLGAIGGAVKDQPRQNSAPAQSVAQTQAKNPAQEKAEADKRQREVREEQERAKREQAEHTVASSTLVRAYIANEVAADEKYKSKTLFIKGRVTKIGKDILDNPFVVLASGDVIREVQCLFSSEHKAELANLSVGREVTIKGKCNGLMMNVQIGDCELIPR